MKRLVLITFLLVCFGGEVRAHDVNGITINWNREISRIFYRRCGSCHRPGGTAFSLMTYQDARPWALAIKEQVLSRKMPPWGAVKGFGDFRNDEGLSREELELITDWVDGGIRRGNNPNMLPEVPKFKKSSTFKIPKNAITVSGDYTLKTPIVIDGLLPVTVLAGSSMQIVATLPNGTVEPLVWLYEYKDSYQHPFLFQRPIRLAPGTVIQGVPPQAKIALLPR